MKTMKGGTCQSSEGGYYDDMAHVISSLDEPGSEQYHSIDMWDASILGLPLLLML